MRSVPLLAVVVYLCFAQVPYPSFEPVASLRSDEILPRFPHHENQPVTIGAGDFDGDGYQDIVAGSVWNNRFSNQIALFKGKGDGSFSAPIVIRLGARPQELRIADLNGDGLDDVALITQFQDRETVEREGAGQLWIFAGQRDGTLRQTWKTSFRNEPMKLFAGDFDGDGKPDLGVSMSVFRFQVFHGRGDGTFGERELACQCNVSLVADLNGDRRPDLVMQDGSGTGVELNQGNNQFSPPLRLKEVPLGSEVAAADLNGDGIPDLVFGNGRFPGLTVYLGKGDGTFVLTEQLSMPVGLSALRVSDLNKDGFPDILATYWERAYGHLLIFPGLGKGRFGPPISMKTGYTPSDIAVADFNSDQRPDLAISSLGGLSVDIFLQRPLR